MSVISANHENHHAIDRVFARLFVCQKKKKQKKTSGRIVDGIFLTGYNYGHGIIGELIDSRQLHILAAKPSYHSVQVTGHQVTEHCSDVRFTSDDLCALATTCLVYDARLI